MAGGDIHIVVDKHALSEGGSKSEDGSIHIVVDDKTSSSRVVRTMVSFMWLVVGIYSALLQRM